MTDNEQELIRLVRAGSSRGFQMLYAFYVDGGWSAGCTDKLNDFMERVHARNLPLFVSEYGTYIWPDSTMAIDAMLAVCRVRGIGRCAWHWSPASCVGRLVLL